MTHILSVTVKDDYHWMKTCFFYLFFTGEGKAKWLKDTCLEQVQAGTWHIRQTPASPNTES